MKIFTESDKKLAKGIDKKYKWMVRVKSGALYATEAKPCKVGAKIWCVDDVDGGRRLFSSAALASKLFKPIKWRDKEPTRINDIYSNSQPVYAYGPLRITQKDNTFCVDLRTQKGWEFIGNADELASRKELEMLRPLCDGRPMYKKHRASTYKVTAPVTEKKDQACLA